MGLKRDLDVEENGGLCNDNIALGSLGGLLDIVSSNALSLDALCLWVGLLHEMSM